MSALSGRYGGQIQARIERAWQRPRDPIDAPFFRCRVEIDQDRTGRVTEVALMECNGDSRWRLSLVQAIQAASPLPAPPIAAMLAQKALLEFRAAAYGPGMPDELYEPARAQSSNQRESAELPKDVLKALRGTPGAARAGKVVQLRIEGSKVEVGSQPGRNIPLDQDSKPMGVPQL
ncbi:MAG TPA: TonB C-terminal domain-containing protein [Steroidobacteraceae bacterium]|nr:TonB C-terminal domain-containing protein [Steroidobacteraceae bacterium]